MKLMLIEKYLFNSTYINIKYGYRIQRFLEIYVELISIIHLSLHFMGHSLSQVEIKVNYAFLVLEFIILKNFAFHFTCYFTAF